MKNKITSYQGFKINDVVYLKSTIILLSGKIIDLGTKFKITGVHKKSTQSNQLVQPHVFNGEEFKRKLFVIGETFDNIIIRTYVCNIYKMGEKMEKSCKEEEIKSVCEHKNIIDTHDNFRKYCNDCGQEFE